MATAEEWKLRVKAWRESGDKAAVFADAHGLSTKALQWWGSELKRRERQSAKAQPVKMVRVLAKPVKDRSAKRHTTSENGDAAMVVRVSGAEVVLHRGFDAELLRQVVRALGVQS